MTFHNSSSQANFADSLPFVVNNNYWVVTTIGNFDADQKLGYYYAKLTLSALCNPHQCALLLLGWIAESQIKYSTAADRDIREAFWHQIALAAMNGIINQQQREET